MRRNDSGKMPGATVATTLYPYATPVPSPMRVNMLGLRFTSEVQKRWKNGRPPQMTTGVESRNSNQGDAIPDTDAGRMPRPGIISYIATTNNGTVRPKLTQNRRVMLRSSGFSSSFAATVRGSSAMPQIGHEPG